MVNCNYMAVRYLWPFTIGSIAIEIFSELSWTVTGKWEFSFLRTNLIVRLKVKGFALEASTSNVAKSYSVQRPHCTRLLRNRNIMFHKLGQRWRAMNQTRYLAERRSSRCETSFTVFLARHAAADNKPRTTFARKKPGCK